MIVLQMTGARERRSKIDRQHDLIEALVGCRPEVSAPGMIELADLSVSVSEIKLEFAKRRL
jgi:hypothetical protein